MTSSPPSKDDRKEKWTEGPWYAEGPDEFGDYNIHEPKVRLAVAAVVSNLRPAAEVAANAHLTAAAPELYEALSTLAAFSISDTLARNDTKVSKVCAEWCQLKKIAFAALARARGEQP